MRVSNVIICLTVAVVSLAPSSNVSAAPLNAPLIVGYDFSHTLNSGDMALNDTPFQIFDGVASGLAPPANSTTVFLAPNAQDLSPNNRDLWHERRNFTGYNAGSSNVHPRWSVSKVASGGSGLSGIVTHGGALQTSTSSNAGPPSTFASANDNSAFTFANSEFTSNGGFTADFTIEVDKTSVGPATVPIFGVNRITVGILPNSDPGAGKLSASITGTFGASGLGKRVESGFSILKSTAPNAPRPKFDVRVIWETNGAGTADDRLLLFLNGVSHDKELATLDLVAGGNNQRLNVLGFGNTGVANGVLLSNLYIYQGVPPNIPGIPEPAGAMMLAIGGFMMLTSRMRRGV